MYKILIAFISILLLFSCNQGTQKNTQEHAHTNELINESSPYLLQHAHNPVNWHPWGEKALQKAKDENKLLIISIGYAACHWCHVMEHESFEDSLVAQIMNDNFVAIKVDREERPDIDDVYMTACQLITGGGGWPLNAFALPDGRPVWAGTYFPKDQWVNILEQFKTLYETDPAKLEDSAEKLTQGIQSTEELNVVTDDLAFTTETLQSIGSAFMDKIDFEEGGRKGAPKFPMPNNYEFLLKYHHLYNDNRALEATTTTLTKMANGGIYDQIGGGYARYSTDDEWFAPHFEKMLYDNGQLVSLNAQAYKLTKDPLYKRKIEQTIGFVERELMSNDYGFFSSLDADSEGEEGKFYTWQQSEIDSIIADERKSEIFKRYYTVEKNGNWEHTNILHTTNDLDKLLAKYKISEDELLTLIEEEGAKLFAHRASRIRPGLDDKVLSSWNALMARGYSDAYQALGNDKYLDMAQKNMAFIKKNLLKSDFRLDRNYKNGKSSINAFLDDYALLTYACVGMYESTFNQEWLTMASSLLDYVHTHFYNYESRMYNYTSDLDPALVARKSELTDNVIPGSNSMMARSLFLVGTLTYNKDYLDRSKQMMKNMAGQIVQSGAPNFYSNWCQLYLDQVQAPYEVAILGPDAEAFRKEMAANYLGNAILLGGESEGNMALLKDKLQEGRTMIYVCQNKVCKFPVDSVEKALELMR